MTVSLAGTALNYAKTLGWAVHPVNIEKKPTSKNGRNDATTDEPTIKQFFRNGAQIGVATGSESGLFVLDVDLDEKRGINGYETLSYLEEVHGKLPHTPCQKTGRGGKQYLFKYVDGLKNSTGKIGEGIDTRGQGGYIVVAPSRNTNGPYEWLVSPRETPLADVPEWIVAALHKADEAEKAPVSAPNGEDRPYCVKMLGQAIARCATAADGTKHDTLIKMSTWMGGFVPALSETEIEDSLWAAVALRAEDEAGARKTIRDGIAYGKSKPLSVPELRKPIPPNVNPQTGEITEAPTQDTHWLQQGVTLADLQHKPFDPETWVVEDILPEGACLLAAKYKSKKSWLALAIGLPIALGGKALGRLPVAQGRVLYLDLEGKQQRIKKRTRAILGVQNRPWPDNFHVYTTWPQGNDGMDRLEQWFRIYPDTRLVVIDVLSDFRRPMDKYEQPYQYDRATVTPLNQLFERYHAAGLLVHHFNKAKNDDIMDGISGTTGLPSAVNTMWGLSRDVNNSAITILNLRGRDLERDDPIALKWDSYLNIHVIEGPAIEVSRSGEQRAVLTALSDEEPRTPQEIATALGKPVESIKFLLRKLLNDGLVDKPSYGKYIRIVATSAHGATLTHDAYSAHSWLESEIKSERVSGDLDTAHSSAHSSTSASQSNEVGEMYIQNSKSEQGKWDVREGEDTDDLFDDDELSKILGKVGS